MTSQASFALSQGCGLSWAPAEAHPFLLLAQHSAHRLEIGEELAGDLVIERTRFVLRDIGVRVLLTTTLHLVSRLAWHSYRISTGGLVLHDLPPGARSVTPTLYPGDEALGPILSEVETHDFDHILPIARRVYEAAVQFHSADSAQDASGHLFNTPPHLRLH